MTAGCRRSSSASSGASPFFSLTAETGSAAPTDGRKQTLNLTDAGREILERAKLAIRDHETWLKSRFTDKEVSKLIELLTRIHE